MSAQTVVVRKRLPASCEEVFDAWLDAEGMRAWMRPGPVSGCDVTMDARLGGRFRIVMRAPEGEIVNTGEIRILDRPVKLQFTWVSSRWENRETLVTVELRRVGEDCELVLTHERFPDGHSAEQLATGWGQMVERLGERLGGRGDVAREGVR